MHLFFLHCLYMHNLTCFCQIKSLFTQFHSFKFICSLKRFLNSVWTMLRQVTICPSPLTPAPRSTSLALLQVTFKPTTHTERCVQGDCWHQQKKNKKTWMQFLPNWCPKLLPSQPIALINCLHGFQPSWTELWWEVLALLCMTKKCMCTQNLI